MCVLFVVLTAFIAVLPCASNQEEQKFDVKGAVEPAEIIVYPVWFWIRVRVVWCGEVWWWSEADRPDRAFRGAEHMVERSRHQLASEVRGKCLFSKGSNPVATSSRGAWRG